MKKSEKMLDQMTSAIRLKLRALRGLTTPSQRATRNEIAQTLPAQNQELESATDIAPVTQLLALDGPISVAILGSCVTRDIFNRKFNPGYKHLFECVALSNQNSVITLMGEEIDEYGAPGDNISDATWREISAEATRAFLKELIELQPDLLIIDSFADVHFGVSLDSLDRPMTSNRWKFRKTHWCRRDFRRHLDPTSPEYFDLWTKSNKQLIEFVKANCARTEILVHDTWNVTDFANNSGQNEQFPDAQKFIDQNIIWKKYTGWYQEQGISTIGAMHKETKSFEAHPWGKFVVHFETNYHQEFLVKLAAHVIRRNASLYTH